MSSPHIDTFSQPPVGVERFYLREAVAVERLEDFVGVALAQGVLEHRLHRCFDVLAMQLRPFDCIIALNGQHDVMNKIVQGGFVVEVEAVGDDCVAERELLPSLVDLVDHLWICAVTKSNTGTVDVTLDDDVTTLIRLLNR